MSDAKGCSNFILQRLLTGLTGILISATPVNYQSRFDATRGTSFVSISRLGKQEAIQKRRDFEGANTY